MKNKILESAIRQIKKYGIRRFTMDDIAQDLRISKKTLYQHFSSKNQLLGGVLSEAIELEKKTTDEAVARGESWFDKLDAVLLVHSYSNIPYRLIDEINRYFPEESNGVNMIGEYKSMVLRQLLEEGIREGRVRADVNLEIIILALKKVFHTPTDEDFLKQNDLTVNQLLKQFKTIFFYGSLVREDEKHRDERL